MNKNCDIVYFIFLVIIGFLPQVFGQSNYWSDNFSLPELTNTISSDTILPVIIKSENTANDIFKSRNEFEYNKTFNSNLIHQHFIYLLTNYKNSIVNQYVDLSGKWVNRGIFKGKGDIGLDWTPGLYCYKSSNTGIFQAPVDFGPLIDFNIASIPVQIRSGISAYGWNNEFHPRSSLLTQNYHGEPGYYVGCNIGDSLLHWFELPIVANVSALGKSIGSTALGVIKSSLKTAWENGSGDSIYFCLGDSLSNGKELYETGSNSTLYSTVPWKVEHSLLLLGALRGKERFFIRPGVIYFYSVKTIEYPSEPDLLDNVRNNKNGLTLQVASNQQKVLTYDGGISFVWEKADWMYNESASEIERDTTGKKQSINISDYNEYTALTDHDISFRLPYGIVLNYQLHALRDLKKFPYSYKKSGEVITNENEGDRVRILNHGGLIIESDPTRSIELYGETVKNYLYYYRKSRSGESQISNELKVGAIAAFSLGKFRCSENIFAQAEKTDYKFKEVHKGRLFDPPPYSRKFTSLMNASWYLNEQWTITGKWNETYYDKGKWYGKAYSDTTYKIVRDFYAIDSKSIDYSVQLLTTYSKKNIKLECGFLFRDRYLQYYDFSDGKNMEEPFGKGYIMEPSLDLEYRFLNTSIMSKVTRKVNSLDDNIWTFGKYWDIALSVKMEL